MPSKIKIRDRATGEVTVHLAATANEILRERGKEYELADGPRKTGPKPKAKGDATE